MNDRIELRPARLDDEALLFRIYASTRVDEMSRVSWSDEEKQQFLEMQFAAQATFYRQQYPNASFDIIVIDGESAGRLYVDRRDEEIRIIDITLLPEFRNSGIGTTLLRNIFAEASRDRKPIRIHVERVNRAIGLYERLGFQVIGDSGVYLLLERSGAS